MRPAQGAFCARPAIGSTADDEGVVMIVKEDKEDDASLATRRTATGYFEEATLTLRPSGVVRSATRLDGAKRGPRAPRKVL